MKSYSILIFSLIILFGCGYDSVNDRPVTYDTVESIHHIIAKNVKLPSEILELNFMEYSFGSSNRVPGPTDYVSYLRIKVDSSNINKWINNLKPPYNNTTSYSGPQSPQEWWISESQFKTMMLFETKTYFNRYNGWLCADKEGGYIYVYTFTQ